MTTNFSKMVPMGLGVLALSAATVWLLLPGQNATAQNNAAPQAQTPPLMTIAAPGIVEPFTEEREIAAEITGVLGEVRVDENDVVKAGQILAVIKNRELQAKLEGARANVSLREAELLRLKNGAREQERKSMAATLAEAQTSLKWWKSEYDRRSKLLKDGHVSRSTYEDARQRYESALARLNAAKEQLSLIEAPAREDEVAQAEAAIAAAKATVAEVEAFLDKTYIKSPVDGTVLRRYKEQGETVAHQPPTLIFTVGDLSRLRVRTEIDEADIAKIRTGQKVFATADAYPGQKFGGEVIRVANRLGAKSILTDRPSEKTDTKILEAIIQLDAHIQLPVGLRVDVFVGEAGS